VKTCNGDLEDGNRTGFRNVSFYCLLYVLGLCLCVCMCVFFQVCCSLLVFWSFCICELCVGVSFFATCVFWLQVFMCVCVQVCCSVVCNLVLPWFVCGCSVIWFVQVFSFLNELYFWTLSIVWCLKNWGIKNVYQISQYVHKIHTRVNY
jgi:hypothetical protein